MGSVKFTENQQACIDIEGGNVLVSAAAGSGKTAVLTQRVIRLLTGENPISADRLIIVTFTVLAADEMRRRISAKLGELIEQDPTNRALQNQQLLLSSAKISTIHSLCSGLIRENFQKVGISSDFRTADETQLTLIKTDSANEALEELYDGESHNFLELVEFVCVKDDKNLIEMVLSIYDFIRSFPFPKKFLSDAIKMYGEATNIKDCFWYPQIKSHIIDALNSSISMLNSALEQMSTEQLVKEKYADAFISDKLQFEQIKQFLLDGEWDNAVDAVNNFDKARLGSVRKYDDKDFLEALKSKRKSASDLLGEIQKRYMLCNEEEFCADIKILTPRIETLFSIVEKVYDKIEDKKQEQGVIDFADLEHFTIKLLVNQTENGYEKTEIAYELAESFDEIMIDECQDINEVQNLIFKVLSKKEQNIFMVGDVKQSVYRFRKASPKIFIEKKNSFPFYDEENHNKEQKAKIILEQNFRSRAEVCKSVNYIFLQIMSEEIGEINYNQEESLVPSAKYDEYDGATPEVHIVEYNRSNDVEKAVVEAHHIGKTIKKMVSDGYLVQGKKGMRQCAYRDFAILLRAKKGKAKVISEELNAMGVPCFSDSTEGYFNEYEITVALNLLRVIDNPLLDICLLSVLMSPMFGFSADLITQIRLSKKNVPLYIAVAEFAESGDAQCCEFVRILSLLRQKAVTVKTDEILQEIYDQTDFISLSYALGNGKQKDANLRLLLTYAKQYDGIGSNGLSGFLRYIDRVIQNKQDFNSANTISQNADTVRVMSIHGSKGLEFPICIVADCGKKFNKMDLNKSFQLNSQSGFGMKIMEQESLKSYSNFPFEAIRLQTEKEALSEEMRVLYVALTRAKEKLIMVMTMEKAEEHIAKIATKLSDSKKLPPFEVYSANSYADWILSAAIRHPSLAELRKSIGTDIKLVPADFHLSATIFQTNKDDAISEVVEKERASKPDEKIMKTLRENFAFKYENEELTKIPAKLTVSQIAKKKQDQERKLTAEPNFLQEKAISPKMRGTILHSFMQFASYEKARENIDTEVERLVNNGFITKAHSQVLNIPKIKAFLNSSLYKRMESAEQVLREYKFLHFIKAKDADNTLDGEIAEQEILIQGIADCLIFEDDGIVIVDYKTDYVNNEGILIERYFDQLKFYKQAVEQSFEQKVKQCLLYSLHLEKEVEIKF